MGVHLRACVCVCVCVCEREREYSAGVNLTGENGSSARGCIGLNLSGPAVPN